MSIWNRLRVICGDKEYYDKLRNWLSVDLCGKCERKCIGRENKLPLKFLIGCFVAEYPEDMACDIVENIDKEVPEL